MNMYEQMSAHCVKVNDGSGVLVNAMSGEYSYVLTARHVLKKHNTLTNHVGAPIEVIDVHEHANPDFDCAVIQVEYVSYIQQSTWLASLLKHHASLMVAGFPTTRRTSTDQIKHQDGKLTSFEDESFIFTAEGIPPKEVINGMSGSGVYYLHDGRIYLTGVEYRMDGDVTAEQFGRLKCHGLSHFEEIIAAIKLAPMVPYFLKCFSRLKKKIFGFNVIDPDNVKKLKEKLDLVADRLLSGKLPAPYELMLKYDKSLLLSRKNMSALQDKELWVAYFEFIIICVLIDDVDAVDDAYLQGLERKRRIIYSSTDAHWVRNLADILKAAKQMLDRNGTIVVISPQENAPVLPPQHCLENIIDDITSVPTSGSILQIDNVSEDTYKTFTVTHLKGLRNSCVVEKEWEYKIAKSSAQLPLFRRYYSAIVK